MFQKDIFANILSDINNSYPSMTEFAKKANLDRTYISKYINKKLNNPPTPKILEKIASASNGISTYESLMKICGYFGNIRGERLKSCRLRRNLSIEEVAKQVNISSKKLLLWENGHDYNMDLESTLKLSKLYNVDFNWLSGSNIHKEISSDDFQELTNIQPLVSLQQTKIPILGEVKAGFNYLAQETWIGTIDLDKRIASTGEFFALKVKGDSMSPIFLEGDIVIIRKQNDCENNEVAVVIVNGDEGMLKKVKKTDAGIILQSFNTAYMPILYTKEEMKSIPVLIAGVFQELRRTKLNL